MSYTSTGNYIKIMHGVFSGTVKFYIGMNGKVIYNDLPLFLDERKIQYQVIRPSDLSVSYRKLVKMYHPFWNEPGDPDGLLLLVALLLTIGRWCYNGTNGAFGLQVHHFKDLSRDDLSLAIEQFELMLDGFL